jgi:ribonuclease BN (tRNA processing enzyme)
MTGAQLTILGSGDAFSSGGHGNACYLVEDAAGAFCVDFGPSALMNLKRFGHSPDALDLVLLTHLHGDHFGGLHLLFIDFQYDSRRRRPITIAGPPGTERKVEAWYRLAYGRAGRARTYETRYVELRPGERQRLGTRRVEAFAANHMRPRDAAMHLKVTTGGATLAFSGDSGWSPALPALAAGADILVCECTELEPHSGQHLSWQELSARLGELPARQVVLSHLGREVRARAARSRTRSVIFARDGMSFRAGAPR